MNESATTYVIQSNVADLFELVLEFYQTYSQTHPELLPYLGTLGANRMDWLLNEPNLPEEVLKVAAKYLKPMYALEHLNGNLKNRIKRILIHLAPRLFVRIYYKKWLPRLEK